jgi:hypothetical protein
MPRAVNNLTRGIQPHFLNRLIEVDAEETPAFSMLPKGDPLRNPIAQYPIDTKDVASKVGKADNVPTQGASSTDNYRILTSQNHWLDEPVSVGKKAQNLVDQAGIGLKKQYGRAVEKKMKAIKTAADQVICDDAEARAEGTNGKGSETRGLLKWAQSTAQSVDPVDALYRTPAGQISTANFDALFESTIQGQVNTHFAETGKVGKFIALAGIYYKQRVSNWSIIDDAGASLSYIRRFTGDASKEGKILAAMVNVLLCDGGRVELHLSRNIGWTRDPSAKGTYTDYSMIGWNQGAAELRFGWGPEHDRLPADGAGMKGHIDMDFAVCADPTGLIKYVPAALS